ncbi:heterodisulfide reductase-related iron-sulfur binding cluster [Sporomusa sp.]|uniref:heterodisulfide reductase-related iron-sulfur binding cluster n=1 Tax=Sporomusa sp. TaxID=2078658 RepID=UPI002CFD167A|nr:heterodisulfide reductase-related iron-sulfur binding cluster [Sporomusa sp.]HWR08193.1 heterodisulfide reductase-related iron-sulfur binding cluster [Sporomusa sp.]
MAGRQIYWNIEGHNLLYLLFAIAIGFFIYGVYRRLRLWRLGRPENRWCHLRDGIQDSIVYGFGHKRLLQESYPGYMHLLIFWGFAFLVLATMIVAIHADLGFPIYQGFLYLFVKFTANLFGLLAVAGIMLAAWRRYVLKPRGLDNQTEDAITLSLILSILVTGFLLQAVRMAAVPDPWAGWAFAGKWLAVLFAGLDGPALVKIHQLLWWFHAVLVMVFFGYFPYSKLFHILLVPLNHLLRKRGNTGVLEPIDFEDESLESYGKGQLSEFSWKTLFDTDVCVRCGRCQDHCPAFVSGKQLTPKGMIQAFKGHMEAAGRAKTQITAAGSETAAASEFSPAAGTTLIGGVIAEEDLWSCTTCRSCEQQCPGFIEHVDKIIEMRRNIVLMENPFPAEARQAFRNMENNGNPWGIGSSSRADFLKSLGVPTYEDNPAADILYWPGCSGAFDARSRKVSQALVRLLQAARVNFAILGNAEKCCGDSARRLGNEYLYSTLAMENIEVMKAYGVKKILTQCPHCFQVLKKEYPQLDGNFVVVHHTEFLLELVKAGALPLNSLAGKTVTYHDSCYLGRYNQIYTQPRELLAAVGLSLRELPRSLEKGFCCGAGGGRMWLEERSGEAINMIRAQEAAAVNTDMIASACPFCLTMLGDGIAALAGEETGTTLDIAEILEQALAAKLSV